MERDSWARLVSLIFHPLIVPTMAVVILYTLPSFVAFSIPLQIRRIVVVLVFVNTFLAPLLIMILMKKTGLINNLVLDDRMERIYPTLATVLFYIFTWYLLKQANMSTMLYTFVLGAATLVFIGLVVTMFWKISFHMMSMGGFTGFIIILAILLGMRVELILVMVVLISGLVGSARLKLNAHNQTQVYVGYLTGISTMLLVFFYLRG